MTSVVVTQTTINASVLQESVSVSVTSSPINVTISPVDINSHSSVTIGTANGLSLSGQVLSLGLSSALATGALSSADWSVFNGKLSDAPMDGATYGRSSGTWVVAAGVTNHALLSNLSYAASGHTGFQASLGFTPVDSASANYIDLTDGGGTTLHTHSYEPIDATIVRTGQANYIDLTDGGATILHSHAGGGGDISGTGVVGRVAEFVTDTKTIQAANLIAPTGAILTLINASVKSITFPGSTNDTVAMLATANVYTTQQFIDGTSDQIQLRIQAHATKTTNLVTIENSSAAVLGGFDSLGRVFGYGNPAVTTNFMAAGAGNATITGGNNVFIGTTVAGSATSAAFNVGIGQSALFALTSGASNFALGREALVGISTTSANVAIGQQALRNGTTLSQNVAIGGTVGQSITGIDNVIIGYNAAGLGGTVRTSIDENVIIGMQSMFNLGTSSDRNTAVGIQTAFSLTSGSSNIFIGAFAGYRQTIATGLLIVDNVTRADIATELTNAIIVGTMAATPAGQTLKVNAVLNVTENIQVDGTQVITNRVIDARIDDVINSGDATTDGVIDAIRDALIAHGLVAAA